jgi:hypothetical protein
MAAANYYRGHHVWFLPPASGSDPATQYSGRSQLSWCSGSRAHEMHAPSLRPRLVGGSLGHAVYTLPSFASPSECDALVAEAAELLKSYKASDERNWLPNRSRLPLTSHHKGMLLRRLLAFIEAELPELAVAAFGQATGLADMAIYFAIGEPAVNIYTTGGEFKPHTDKEDLTMILPLSPPGAFEGGGTAFWRDGHTPAEMDGNADESEWLLPDHVVNGAMGTGVVFSGQVTHAGLPVTSGTRHLFVMSFSVRPPDGGPEPTPEEQAAKEEADGRELAEEMDMSALAEFVDDFE